MDGVLVWRYGIASALYTVFRECCAISIILCTLTSGNVMHCSFKMQQI